jgi:signal transduction histidine kinase/ActR/RegA family two-component response regulator
MNRRQLFLAAAFLAAMSPCLALAEDSTVDPPAVLVIGGGDNFKPFHYLEDGEPAGFDVDLTWAIARVMGLDVEVRLDYWQDVRADLADRGVQVHIGMTHSPERAQEFDFTSPYLNQQYKIFVDGQGHGIGGEADLAGKRIIVQQEGAIAEYLQARGLADQAVLASSAAEALRMLVLGEGDCCLMTEFRGITVAQDLGLDGVHRVGPPVHSSRYGYAVIKGRDDLVLTLNQGLALLKASGEYDRIYEHWFGVLDDPGLTTWDYLRMAAWVILPLAAALMVAALWSWLLRRQVVRQTAELRRARDQAEAASRAKSRFLTAVSHEIRTPLNGVLGMAQVLGGTPLATDQQDHLAALRRSAAALQDIINDILEFSCIDAGRRDLAHLDFSLHHLVREVLDTVAPEAWSKGLVLESTGLDNLPDGVRGDPGAVRQVMESLLNNAVKFTNEGSVGFELTAAVLAGDRVCIEGTVLDSGQGIAVEQRGRLFQAFSQVDDSSTRRHGGTGLGLAICKSLTELMDGWVSYEPREGGGSCFRFAMVLDAVADAPAGALPGPQASKRRPAPTPDGDAPRRILVVEDNPTNQRVVCLLLKAWGHDFEVAADGMEAVTACRRERFDAILMDCQMPVMDGLEATRRIRQIPGDRGRAPIVAVTAGGDLGSRHECLAAGMDDYLTKPISAPKLREVLEAQLAANQELSPVK